MEGAVHADGVDPVEETIVAPKATASTITSAARSEETVRGSVLACSVAGTVGCAGQAHITVPSEAPQPSVAGSSAGGGQHVPPLAGQAHPQAPAAESAAIAPEPGVRAKACSRSARTSRKRTRDLPAETATGTA